MLDIAIIGSGPAGMSAAINVKNRNKDVMIFGNDYSTSLLYKAEKVNNYLGFYDISGKELLDNYYNHCVSMGVNITNKRVIEIYEMGTHFVLNVENDFIEAKSVIITNGISKKQTINKEDDYIGKGVSYCATCDGNLYKGKDVVVIAESDHAESEANFLSELCSKVTYIPTYKDIKNLNSNIEIEFDKPKEVIGDNVVQQLKLANKTIDTNAIFIINNSIAPSKLIKNIELNGQYIKVDQKMRTNIKGLFAAGDCVGGLFQVSKATGEAQVAALNAVEYVSNLK